MSWSDVSYDQVSTMFEPESTTHRKDDQEDEEPLLACTLQTGEDNHEKARKGRVLRARVVSIIVLMLSISAGNGNDPMMAQYLMDRLSEEAGLTNNTEVHPCIANSSDPYLQEVNRLQRQTSQELLHLTLCQTVPAFFACLFLGSYADYFGRRPLLIVPVTTLCIKMCMVAVTIRLSLPIWVFRIGYGVDGLCGSWFAILIVLYSMNADTTSDTKSRSMANYLLGSGASILFAITYYTNGYVIAHLGYFWASLSLVALSFLSVLVAFFFYPETLQRQPTQQVVLNPLHHLRRIFGFYLFDGTWRRRATFTVCLAIFFFGVIVDLAITSIDALFQIHAPFCWQSTQIGLYKSIRGLVTYFGALPLLKVSQRFVSDEHIAMVSVLFQCGGYLFESFIQHSWQFYIVPVILIPSVLMSPIIRCMLSELAGEEHYGAVYSSVAIVETLCTLTAGALFNSVFALTVDQWPGAVYIAMASCGFFTFLLFILYFSIRVRGLEGTMVVVPSRPHTQVKRDPDSHQSPSTSSE